MTNEELYKMASQKWNCYHFNMEGRQNYPNDMHTYMGENLINVTDHTKIPEMMAKIISSHVKTEPAFIPVSPTAAEPGNGPKVTL